MKIEDVMERLIFFLYDAITEMLILTEEERFEEAAKLRDEIDYKMLRTAKYLIKKELTTLPIEDLLDNLMDVKLGFIKEITELLQIPEEHHII